jgi:uncharacterized MAPEG superfamily protein
VAANQCRVDRSFKEITMMHAYPALMTLLMVLWYVVTGFQVGRARARYKVRAPATTGDPAFERAYRVQMNELEQLAGFLPAMWIFAWFGDPRLATLGGIVWLTGRIIYAVGYWTDARKRSTGFTISMFAFASTWVAALGAVLRQLDWQ